MTFPLILQLKRKKPGPAAGFTADIPAITKGTQQIKRHMHMRKLTSIVSVAAVALAIAGTAFAERTGTKRLVLKTPAQKTAVKRYLGDGTFKPVGLKSPQKASSKSEAILIDEDFSNMKAGTVDKPDTTQMLACAYSGYSPNGIYIDNSLTKDGTWFGNFVYSAGGAVAIKTYNPQVSAYISTPLGDYSGDITVTCKVKALPALIKTETGYAKTSGSSLNIAAFVGGYESYEYASTDDAAQQCSERIYENQGWQKVTYTFKNFSSDNGGYICFYTEGALALDDIQVTTAASFIAQPTIGGITDFGEDQFTIEWQPVRKAYNYYVDLFTKNYTSDKDTTFTADFEDGTVPAGFSTTSKQFSDDEGCNSSRGLKLMDGDTLTFPTNDNVYKKLNFYLRTIDETVDKTDEYAAYDVEGYLEIDYKADDGWKNIAEYYASGFWEPGDTVKLADEMPTKFNKLQATQWRVRAVDLNEGAYFVIDDVDIEAAPSFEWKLVEGENSMDYGGNYTAYDTTKKTYYTFTGLDPNTEYYYGVRSHYMYLFSDRKLSHALGVAAPEALDATDIDSRGAFTANWEKAPKATGYTVSCFGVTTADKDYQDYPVLDEDFSKIDASVTTGTGADDAVPLGNAEGSSLDAYTSAPGWTGSSNTASVGMLGADGDYYDGGYIKTPVLDLRHADSFKLTLEGKAEDEDQLVLRVGGKNYYLTVPDGGEINGTYIIPKGGIRSDIKIMSYYAAPFIFDRIKVTQNVSKDDQILTWLDEAETDAETTSYTFTDLADYGFADYAFHVVSNFKFSDMESTSSLTPSELVVVNLEKGTSTGITEVSDATGVKVVARYSADGRLVSSPVKGLNIIRLSNGKTVKVVVK